MGDLLLLTTAQGQAPAVALARSALARAGLGSAWLHLKAPTETEPDLPDGAEPVALEPASLAPSADPSIQVRASYELADRLRGVALKLHRARMAGGAGSPRLRVVVLASLGEHDSNLAALLALGGAREARRLLGGHPDLTIDLAGILPDLDRPYVEQATCLRLLEQLQVERPVAPCRLLLALEAGSPEAQAEALTRLVLDAHAIEQAHVAVAGAGSAPCLALYGGARIAYQPGDLLAAWSRAAGPDLRRMFLLRPVPEEQEALEPLLRSYALWREQVERRIGETLAAHLAAGVRRPTVPEAPSRGDDPEAALAALRAWLEVQAAASPELAGSFEGLDPALVDDFTRWFDAHLDALIDDLHLSLPELEAFAASLSGGPAAPLSERELTAEIAARLQLRCRGDLAGPLVAPGAQADDLDITPLVERALEAGDPRARVLAPIAASLPASADEERLVAWMDEQLHAHPARVLTQIERGLEALDTLEGELGVARAEAGRFFARKAVKEKAAALEGQRRALLARVVGEHAPLAAAWPEQLRQCHGRARELGGWRALREALADRIATLHKACQRVRAAIDATYRQRSDGDATWALIPGLLTLPGLAPEEVGRLARAQEQDLRAGRSRIAQSRQVRAWSSGPAPEFLALIPVELAERIPMDLEQALLGTPAWPHPETFTDVVRDLVQRCAGVAGLDTGPVHAVASPLALPILALPGGDQGALARALAHQSPSAGFLPASAQLTRWVLGPGANDTAHLGLFFLGLDLGHLARHQALVECAEEHRQRCARLGEEGADPGVAYRRVLDQLAGVTSDT
ncbi:MAG: hypothetical protein ABIO70_01680 [Pseudomonadota bacterium]